MKHTYCRAVLAKFLLTKLMTELTTMRIFKNKRHMTGPDANLTKKYRGLLVFKIIVNGI
jgi:hypothetical protein